MTELTRKLEDDLRTERLELVRLGEIADVMSDVWDVLNPGFERIQHEVTGTAALRVQEVLDALMPLHDRWEGLTE